MGELTSGAAAARLGVKPATLYAYVSRGLLRRAVAPDGRASLFDEAEVERLARRAPGTRRTAHDLLIESDVTTIDPAGHRYRGVPAFELADAGAGFERVAEFLWTGVVPEHQPRWRSPVAGLEVARAAQAALPEDTLPIDRFRVTVTAAAAAEPLRFDIRPEAVLAHAGGLVALFADAWPLRSRSPRPSTIARRVWPRLTRRPPTGDAVVALDAVLVLLADHELAASTVAVRIAAAYEADPYAAVSAGLGVMSGARHGGASLGSEELLDDVIRTGDAARVVGERLRAGQLVHGFGQPLYPEGDPRFSAVVALARRAAPEATVFSALDALVEVADGQRLPRPNVDLAIATFSRATSMCRGGGEAIFSIARTAGWLAHVIEEYEQRTRFRLRATARRPRP